MVRRGGADGRAGANPNQRGASGDTGGGLLRTILVAGLVAAVAYVVSRRLRRREGVPNLESVRETAREHAPIDGQPIPIGEPSGADETSGDERGADGGAAGPSGETLGDEPSDEEISELGEENVQDEPAEPGTMTVDEDVVDELVDDGEASADEDEAPSTDGEGSADEDAE
ncbi:hypothetical protein ACFQGT_19635 [Natrialbaceae archaeon GCM10025810]|uniref:hypothetical protein n=1 Tax=Halovalidus salilacus TaxID=3075124 RepID=UPI0036178B89